MTHMETPKLFTEHQHGFRIGHSCVTQFTDICEKWTEELDNCDSPDIIYSDIQKAFDSGPHQRLLTKLQRYGVQSNVLKWIQDFLRNRMVGWLVGCIGFNGPLKQYFSLYQAVSQRGRKK